MSKDVIDAILGRRPKPPRSPIVEAIIIGEIVGESVKQSIRPQVPAEVPVFPTIPEIPREIALVQAPALKWERRIAPYFSEGFQPSKSRITIYETAVPEGVTYRNQGLVDFTMHSTSNSYSVMLRRDGTTMYATRALSHTEWSVVSAELTKINAYRDASTGKYVWGAYDIPFQKKVAVVIVDGEDVVFDSVIATVEFEELTE